MELGTAKNSEIVKAVAEKAGISKVLARQVFFSLSEVIGEKLKDGKQVRLPYVGAFHFMRKAPMKSNLTGELIPAHHQVKFRFHKDLARYIRTMTREL